MSDDMSQKKQDELNSSKKALKTGAKAAANAYAGPLGGKAVDIVSNTKLGNAVLNKGANTLQHGNPNLAKIINKADKTGILDKADQVTDLASGQDGLDDNGTEGLSNKSSSSSGSTNLLDSAMSGKKKGLINNISGNGSNNTDNTTNTDNINSDYGSKIFKFISDKKYVIISSCSGLFMTILTGILVIVVIGSIGAAVIDFFKGIGDAIVGFFTKSQEELAQDFIEQLAEVKEDIKNDYNLCIDVNLITAALTVNIDPDQFIKDGQNDVEDDEENAEGEIVYTKSMIKNIKLLANMQMITPNYELDSSDDYCSDNGDKILITSGSKDSSTMELVASHDKDGVLALFTSKTTDEENNAYYIYKPSYDSDGVSCSRDYAEEQLEKLQDTAKKEVSIGDLKTRKDSVFYWNLVNSFVPSYYSEYIPSSEPQKSEAIYKIADDIYLLYNDFGSSCSSNSCVVLPSTSLCPNGIEVEDKDGSSKLIDFESYVAGVVAAENSWHDGNNIESLKAQAIAARTYALKKTNSCESSIKNSTVNQTYKETDDPYILRAVRETSGMVITYNNELYSTEYDAFCVADNSGDNYILKQKNQAIPKSWADNHGAVSNVYKKCLCNAGTDLDICRDADGVYLDGGHGRGMSQIGARYLQTQGYTYKEILNYYYGDNVVITSTINNDSGGTNLCESGGTSIIGNFVSHTCEYGLGSVSMKYWKTFYGKDDNALNTFNYPQCTWYTYGRAIMALEESTHLTATEARDLMYKALMRGSGRSANAADWFDLNVDSGVFAYSTDITKPKPGAIIVWSGGEHGYGHVGFIENVEYDEEGNAEYVWVTEGNRDPCYYNRRTMSYIQSYAPEPKTKYFRGYIYVVSDGG